MKRYLIVLVATAIAATGCAGSSGGRPAAAAEVRQGLQAASRSYWQEAHFRFSAAHRLEPDNPAVLNNLAVALEALGRYDEALQTYKRALELAPANRSIRRNYARFAEFYTSFARGAKPKEGVGDATR
ncbi:MAG: tetratricopeptide repeat protein [Acidobacteriota bacterium]|jgi:Flp pilus assembly protein TadD